MPACAHFLTIVNTSYFVKCEEHPGHIMSVSSILYQKETKRNIIQLSMFS